MSNIKSEGATTMWLAKPAKTVLKQGAANPKAGLCFQEEGNSVVLTGKVEIKASSSQLCITEIQGHHATIWIDGHFVRRNL